jgi:hypothetical protein
MIYFMITIGLDWSNKKNKNELSAYSVFNKNQQQLAGTFSAKDIEKSMYLRQ